MADFISRHSKMKPSTVLIVCFACLVAMVAADYGYGYGAPSTFGGGQGNSGFLMLIGLLFLMLVLFGFNNGQDSIVLVNVTS